MRIESKLCHLSENKAVVQATGWHNEKNLGSALAEGITVEIAEDKAISRLYKRINTGTNNEVRLNSIKEHKIKTPLNGQLLKQENSDNINIANEPSDWSDELIAIDIEIKRLKWSRDDEINFLQKKMGYNNRNKITNYSDILNYLNLLKNADSQNLENEVQENVNSLIEQSDKLLTDLSWNHIQGREYLQQEFNVSTRKELSIEQLKLFVQKLKSIRNEI